MRRRTHRRTTAIVETLIGYLDALASSSPTPGGGSAACIVGAQAAALVAMVARITGSGSVYVAVHPLAQEIAKRAEDLRRDLLKARERDEEAYGAVSAARLLPKTNEHEKALRATALQKALRGAAEAPLTAMALALDVLELAQRARKLENPHLISDLACASDFAAAAFSASAHNVRVNHLGMKDDPLVAEQRARLGDLETRATRIGTPI